jgi:hypothetical protein
MCISLWAPIGQEVQRKGVTDLACKGSEDGSDDLSHDYSE